MALSEWLSQEGNRFLRMFHFLHVCYLLCFSCHSMAKVSFLSSYLRAKEVNLSCNLLLVWVNHSSPQDGNIILYSLLSLEEASWECLINGICCLHCFMLVSVQKVLQVGGPVWRPHRSYFLLQVVARVTEVSEEFVVTVLPRHTIHTGTEQNEVY